MQKNSAYFSPEAGKGGFSPALCAGNGDLPCSIGSREQERVYIHDSSYVGCCNEITNDRSKMERQLLFQRRVCSREIRRTNAYQHICTTSFDLWRFDTSSWECCFDLALKIEAWEPLFLFLAIHVIGFGVHSLYGAGSQVGGRADGGRWAGGWAKCVIN